MAFFGELGSINAVLKSATGLISEIKRPRLKSDDFARLLEAQVQQANPTKSSADSASRPETVVEKATRLSSQYMQLHDADRSGTLSMAESGLDEAAFSQIDIDGDGALNSAELQAAATSRILARYQQ